MVVKELNGGTKGIYFTSIAACIDNKSQLGIKFPK